MEQMLSCCYFGGILMLEGVVFSMLLGLGQISTMKMYNSIIFGSSILSAIESMHFTGKR